MNGAAVPGHGRIRAAKNTEKHGIEIFWTTSSSVLFSVVVTDRYHLHRFVEAQTSTYDQALAEIGEGRKRSHWMWFIFPQVEGLGSSPMAVRYAIKNRDEASAFLAHPVLGPRLIECAEAVLQIEGRSALEIFGSPDDLKLRSCATLFAAVSPDESVFHRIIDKYFDGRQDVRTTALMRC